MSDINISERQAGDVTILDLEGKVTIGEGSVALRGAIRRLLGEGKNKIGVHGRSTSGIGVRGQSSTGVGVYGAVADPNSLAGYFRGDVLVDGDFTVTGAKGAVVPHPDRALPGSPPRRP